MNSIRIKLALVAMFFMSFCVKAQNIGLSSGEKFEFKKGAEEWSESVKVELSNKEGESIPLSIRIKFKKKMLFACHYYLEITNLSESKTVKFEVGNGYTDANGKEVTEKMKLAPKAMEEGKIIYAEGLKKPKSAQDCIDCVWSMRFYNVKIK